MTAQGMNHFTILAEDLGATMKFYTEFLGLKDGYRPDLGFPGAWMYAQAPTDHTGQAVLHIIAGRPMPNPRSGVIDHMAYTAKGMAAAVAKLEAHGIKYMKRKQAGLAGTWQVFFYDPNGARIELDFAAAEGD